MSIYGYKNEESANVVSAGKFGMNLSNTPEVEIKEDKNGKEYLSITCDIDGREYRAGVFELKQVYGKDNVVITDPTDKLFVKAANQMNKWVNNFLACFATQEDIQEGMANVSNYATFIRAIKNIFDENSEGKKCWVFLEWQWSVKADNTKTYLQIPKNAKHGLCFLPYEEGDEVSMITVKREGEEIIEVLRDGEEVEDFELEGEKLLVDGVSINNGKWNEGLVVTVNGEKSKITRSGWYMSSASNYHSQQDLNSTEGTSEGW